MDESNFKLGTVCLDSSYEKRMLRDIRRSEKCFVFSAGLTIQIMPSSAAYVVTGVGKIGIVRV